MTSLDKKYPDLATIRFQIHGVFKNFHSGERIKKLGDSYAGFTGYVWTKAKSGEEKQRIKKYPDTYGRCLKWTLSRHLLELSNILEKKLLVLWMQ